MGKNGGIVINNTFSIPKRIESIQVLRFLAALIVAFSHFHIVSAFENTRIFVDFSLKFFFILSGFIVMLSTEKAEKRLGFFGNRIIRLAPLYWLLTIATFAGAQVVQSLLGYTPTIEHLFKSMSFIPFSRDALKDGEVIRPIVGLGHTLQMEVLFSAIFAICMKISHKYRGVISCCVLFVLAALGRLIQFKSAFCKFYLNQNYLSLIAFLLGIGCYYFLKHLQNKQAKNKPIMLFSTVSIAALAVLWYIFSSNEFSIYLILGCRYLILVSSIVFACAYSSYGWRVPKLLVKLGDASFSFYLVHYFIVSLSERALHIDSFNLKGISLMLIIIVICWVAAYISYCIIEKKFCGWLSKKYKNLLMWINSKRTKNDHNQANA